MPAGLVAEFLNAHPLLDTLAGIATVLVKSAVVLAFTFFLARFATHRFRDTLEKRERRLSDSAVILLVRILWTAIWAVGILLVVYLFGNGLTPLAAFIGVAGLAASLSLQQLLQNLVAGVYLLAERPFDIGDVVSVVGPSGVNHEGAVQDIQMRITRLRGRDDELILVPNSAMFAGVVTNRTAVGGYATEVKVTFPREMDPNTVRGQIVDLLGSVGSVLPMPQPELRIDRAGKEDWIAAILFWAKQREAKSDVVWAIAYAFPDVTVSGESTTA